MKPHISESQRRHLIEFRTIGAHQESVSSRWNLSSGLRRCPKVMFLLTLLHATFFVQAIHPPVEYTRLYSFGAFEQFVGYPRAAVIEGSDGALYGTTCPLHLGPAGKGAVFKVNKDGSGYSVLHMFTASGGDGSLPHGKLMEGSDGMIYGTTVAGGTSDWGTLFRVNKDGSGYTVLRRFNSNDGAFPYGGLLQGSDGTLYGITYSGGPTGYGAVFKVNPDGTAYSVLRSFIPSAGDGYASYATLIEGSDGALYGTTDRGGTAGLGTVFKIAKDGSGYAVLRNFTGSGGDGQECRAGVVEGSDGALYGTTLQGGNTGRGTVFKLQKDGGGYTVLRSFTGTGGDGRNPYAQLIEGADGAIYGTTSEGGTVGAGTVFKLNKNGTGYSVVYNINFGGTPFSGVIQGSDGALYGTANFGGSAGPGLVFKVNADGSAPLAVASFPGSVGDARYPSAGVIEASDGALYGTTYSGGAYGYGAVFKVKKDGSGYRLLQSFTAGPSDGAYPNTRVIEGSDGALYGTTYQGGPFGYGTVFKVNKDGTGFTVLRFFAGGSSDGQYPSAEVTEGGDGALYGTTGHGGPGDFGIIFRINKDGSGYTVLRSFAGAPGSDGDTPVGLIEGSDGALYGATAYGGSPENSGTLFKLNKDGTGYAVLRALTVAGGAQPVRGVIEGGDGALYGTTFYGGSWFGGTVFKINKDGSSFTVLKNFTGNSGDGAQAAGLIEGSDGTLHGATRNGGTAGFGTVFRLKKDGSDYSVLRSFTGGSDGLNPFCEPIQGSDGALYGTTFVGGDADVGVIFKLFSVAPIAADESFTTAEDTAIIIAAPGLLANDTDPNGDLLTVVSHTPPALGDLTLNADGSFTYTPFANKSGVDTFTYTISDGMGHNSSATVTITVTAVYDPPVATPLVINGLEDNPVSITLSGTAVDLLDTSNFSVLRSFSEPDGLYPEAELMEDADGVLYGTTDNGGTAGLGTLFRIAKSGSDFQVLKNFDGGTESGGGAYGGIILASDGFLYGGVYSGGAFGAGAVFRSDRTGASYDLIHSFEGGAQGADPYGTVIECSDGLLYGTTAYGGATDHGLLFRMAKNGSNFEILHHFGTGDEASGSPFGRLLEGSDGVLYGTTIGGGLFVNGSVFRIDKNGQNYAILHSFFSSPTDGWGMYWGVTEAVDGLLYGCSYSGGSTGNGIVFSVARDGTDYRILHNFGETAGDGTHPDAAVIQGSDGKLYGSANMGGPGNGGTIFRLNRDGTGYKTLKTFVAGGASGDLPFAALTASSDGALYGSTYLGGDAGGGTIFKLQVVEAEITYSLLTAPTHGTLSGTLPNLTYTPAPDFHGTDTFTYQIFDGITTSAPAVVTINVADVLMAIGGISVDTTSLTATVTGSNFEPDTVVYWNGVARTTSFESSTRVTAALLAADLSPVTDITTVLVRVGEPAGPESNAAPYVLLPTTSTVNAIDVAVAGPGEATVVTTQATAPGEGGLQATVQNNGGGEPLAVLAASYESQPVDETGFQAETGAFVDLQITGADAADVATVQFAFVVADTSSNLDSIRLTYFNGTTWMTVMNSDGSEPTRAITHNGDGTITITFDVSFDINSTPSITELTGTVFGMFDGQPQLKTITGPSGPLTLGSTATINVSYAAVGAVGTTTVKYIWDDGTQTISTPNTAGNSSASRKYTQAGVYGVTLEVKDAQNRTVSKRFEYVVIYDPNGGFVTGSGSIISPPGACIANPSLTGKATFGFVSKYQKGAKTPTGDTEFQFRAAAFGFHSTAYDWLVVAGSKAQYKGIGQIDGQSGDYGFLLTAYDGNVNGGAADKFRIKIWNKGTGSIIYDNSLNASDDIDAAAPQWISSGNIMIHK